MAIGGHTVNGALQPGDAAAFLIDAHPRGRSTPEAFARERELQHLLGALDIAREQDDAAEVELTRQGAQLDGDLSCREDCR